MIEFKLAKRFRFSVPPILRPVRAQALAKLSGRIQRHIRGKLALQVQQIYDWTHARRRMSGKPLLRMERWSVWQILRDVAEPIGRSAGRYCGGSSPDFPFDNLLHFSWIVTVSRH